MVDAQAGDWRLLSARLLIRPVEAGDIAAIHGHRAQSPFVPRRDLAALTALYAPMLGVTPGAAGWHQFAVVHSGEMAVIGDIGVNFGGPGPEQAELGFCIGPEWQRRGLGYEAAGRMVNHLFGMVGLHRLVATTDRRNTAARALLAKLRFRCEARTEQSLLIGGQWIDERGYARLAGE